MQITSQKEVENYIMQKVLLQTCFGQFFFLRRLTGKRQYCSEAILAWLVVSLINFLFRIIRHSCICFHVFKHLLNTKQMTRCWCYKDKKKSLLCKEFSAFGRRQTCMYTQHCVKNPKAMFRGLQVYTSYKIYVHKKTCWWMFTTAFSIIAKK